MMSWFTFRFQNLILYKGTSVTIKEAKCEVTRVGRCIEKILEVKYLISVILGLKRPKLIQLLNMGLIHYFINYAKIQSV